MMAGSAPNILYIYCAGNSPDELHAFLAGAKCEAGSQLDRVQNELNPSDWKTIKVIGSDVREMQTAINSAGCCNKPAGECNPNLHPSKLWLIVAFATA